MWNKVSHLRTLQRSRSLTHLLLSHRTATSVCLVYTHSHIYSVVVSELAGDPEALREPGNNLLLFVFLCLVARETHGVFPWAFPDGRCKRG